MVLFLVLAARNVNPEDLVVAGLDDGLVEVRVGGQELKPTVEDVLVRMGSASLHSVYLVTGMWSEAASPKVCCEA